MSQVWNMEIPDSRKKLILLSLADNANTESRSCWPSVSYISKRCGCSVRTTIRHLKSLEEEGYLQTNKRYTDEGRQCTNVYVILTPSPEGDTHDTPEGDTHDTQNHKKEPSIHSSSSARLEFTLLVKVHDAETEFHEWLKVLQKKKVSMAQNAWRRRLTVLQKLISEGEDVKQLFIKSADCGWVGLFGSKNGSARQSTKQQVIRETRSQKFDREVQEELAKTIRQH